MLSGSAMPGEGYTMVAAHNHLNTTEAGPFAMLSFMQEGDRIFVNNAENELRSFRVYANEKLAADDLPGLQRIAGSGSGVLMLITCEDEQPEGSYANRRVIAAEPTD